MEINEINLGKYQINEDGILKYSVDKDGEQKLEVIFPQQIYPNAIIHNITTDNEKLSIRFLKGNQWREVVADKSVTANKNKIIYIIVKNKFKFNNISLYVNNS